MRKVPIHYPLLPLSWLYGLGIRFRHLLFDWGWLPQLCPQVPTICIGNLTVGGTGKTPHTEYLIRLLQPLGTVAVLSRGYKRQSKGYLLATASTPMPLIGDEPYQMKQKFPEALVAVDADRRQGIGQLMQLHPQVVLLDDAFQHRYVKAGLNLLLTDYNRLMTRDALLPAGRLRDVLSSKKRADILLVTKCPQDLSIQQQQALVQELAPLPQQRVFFSSLVYGQLYRMVQPTEVCPCAHIQPSDTILLVTGIANPQPMKEFLQQYTERIQCLEYPDHHAFTQQDVQLIENTCGQPQGKTWLITTEKDATRLQTLVGAWAPEVWVLPIEIQIMGGQQSAFNQIIMNYAKNGNKDLG